MAKIYVASSWRNEFQPMVVQALRADGHEVYDFKDSDGFHWTEVDPEWKDWPADVGKYLRGLNHPCAERGFKRDMEALRACDLCVMVMPCGPSASMEMGWAVGAGRPTAIFTPAIREPDLMVKMAEFISQDLSDIRRWVEQKCQGRCRACAGTGAEFPGNPRTEKCEECNGTGRAS